MTEPTTIQLKIPTELARLCVWQRHLVNKYETNRSIKAVGTWLVLKSLSVPSLLQDWNKQKHYLLKACKCNETTFRSRIKLLAALNLLTYDKHNIRLASWHDAGKALEIDLTKRDTIQYNIHDKTQPHHWIAAIEIDDNQQRQAYSIVKKLNNNPKTLNAIQHAAIKAGADQEAIKTTSGLLTWLSVLYLEDFKTASDIHDLLIELRPDLNRSVRGIGDAWKAKHITTVSYWKKIMKKSGVIDVGKMQVQSDERCRNKYCRVKWLPGAKQTLLPLCDQITILRPWLITTPLIADAA